VTTPRRRPRILWVALGFLAPALVGCGVDDALRTTEECPSFDDVRDRTSTDGLRVAPEHPEPGGPMTVGRTDDLAVHPGVLWLYGDADAGCRVYVLMPGGDGPAWQDVTGDDDVGLLVQQGSRTTAASFTVPDVADSGTYLLCGLTDEVGEEPRCRLLTL
jgi:hypothetical protein